MGAACMEVGSWVQATESIADVGAETLTARPGDQGVVREVDEDWLTVTFENGRTSDCHVSELRPRLCSWREPTVWPTPAPMP